STPRSSGATGNLGWGGASIVEVPTAPGQVGGGGGKGQPTVKDKAKELGEDILACALDHYGLTAVGGSLVAAGANVINTRGKFVGATPNTSLASIAAREIFGDRRFP